ncbi:MAG: YcfL family protein [Kiritimatiellaeota bacterium]|nr:YcfL family protein [Kiritimatiellota bacterium]
MKKLLQGILTAGALCAAGCLSTVDTVENAEKSGVADEVLRLHVETDASTPIRVTNLIQAFDTANGFKKIAVTFTNRSTSPATAVYQCEWFDENLMPVPTSFSQWSEVRLVGRDSKTITFTAPNAIALDYKIRLLEKP